MRRGDEIEHRSRLSGVINSACHGGLHQRFIEGRDGVRRNLRDSISAFDAITNMNDLNFVFLQNNCFQLSPGLFRITNGLNYHRNRQGC